MCSGSSGARTLRGLFNGSNHRLGCEVVDHVPQARNDDERALRQLMVQPLRLPADLVAQYAKLWSTYEL